MNERSAVVSNPRAKAFMLKFAATVVFAVLAAANEVGAQDLPPKFKPIPICAALATAATTTHIPLSGIDRALATNVLHAGDSATILGTIFLKKKEEQWLLYLEARPSVTNTTNRAPMVVHMFNREISFPSKLLPASLQMLGPFETAQTSHQKATTQTAQLELNESFLGVGMDRAAAVIWHWKQTTNSTPATNSPNRSAEEHKREANQKLTPDEQEAIAGIIPALMSYFEIVQHTEGLEDLLTKLVKLPSVWSIVRRLGVTPEFRFGDAASPANPSDWDLPSLTPVYYFPCQLRLNGQPALDITFVVTKPNPPRLICGGVVGVLAEKIGDNETYMTLRVISAKCKPGE